MLIWWDPFQDSTLPNLDAIMIYHCLIRSSRCQIWRYPIGCTVKYLKSLIILGNGSMFSCYQELADFNSGFDIVDCRFCLFFTKMMRVLNGQILEKNMSKQRFIHHCSCYHKRARARSLRHVATSKS